MNTAHPLRMMRVSRGMRIEDLKNATGVQMSTISLIENRKHMPRKTTLEKLADALNCHWTQLMEGEDHAGVQAGE